MNVNGCNLPEWRTSSAWTMLKWIYCSVEGETRTFNVVSEYNKIWFITFGATPYILISKHWSERYHLVKTKIIFFGIYSRKYFDGGIFVATSLCQLYQNLFVFIVKAMIQRSTSQFYFHVFVNIKYKRF